MNFFNCAEIIKIIKYTNIKLHVLQKLSRERELVYNYKGRKNPKVMGKIIKFIHLNIQKQRITCEIKGSGQ